jgi:hypothetical protein
VKEIEYPCQYRTKLEVQTLDYTKDALIAAPIEITWDAVLAELGPEGQMPTSTAERQAIPIRSSSLAGRAVVPRLWRTTTGHLWGHVQVIKPPKLLEIFGPCFISTRRRNTSSVAARPRATARG